MPESIAGIDGRLRKDDLIVAVNGEVLKGITQGTALGMLKNIPKTIMLTVRREQMCPLEDGGDPKRIVTQTEDELSSRSRSESVGAVTRRTRSESRGSTRSKSRERSRSASRLSRFSEVQQKV